MQNYRAASVSRSAEVDNSDSSEYTPHTTNKERSVDAGYIRNQKSGLEDPSLEYEDDVAALAAVASVWGEPESANFPQQHTPYFIPVLQMRY